LKEVLARRSLRRSNELRNLGVLISFQVVQKQHLALDGRQRRDRPLEFAAKFFPPKRARGIIGAHCGIRRQHFGAPDAIPKNTIPRMISDDGAKPIRKPLGVAAILQVQCHSHECIVAHVLGIAALPRARQRDCEGSSVMAPHEHEVCRFLTGYRAPH
jgi:hypothetical protein